MSAVVVGLMSGTSLDGISAAVVRFAGRGTSVTADLLGFTLTEYSDHQRERLRKALVGTTPEEYCRLGFDLGGWLGDAAELALAESGVAHDDVLAVASHGQTVWHVPGHSTWQIGEAAVIAERTRLPVVSNFRVADVAAGGQGAPLVALADLLLFSSKDSWRALQNLGGIGNVTVVPPAGTGENLAPARAFDTGPGVVVIDGVVRALRPGLRFDRDGTLAAAGSPIDAVVRQSLGDRYYELAPPKSTGREHFSPAWIASFIERCRAERPGARDEDIVATAVSLTAGSVRLAFERWIPEPLGDVLVSGGGAANPVLFAAIGDALHPRPVKRFRDTFFDDEAKEAVAFALLGYLHSRGEAGNVPSATGARGRRILGAWTPPPVRRPQTAEG